MYIFPNSYHTYGIKNPQDSSAYLMGPGDFFECVVKTIFFSLSLGMNMLFGYLLIQRVDGYIMVMKPKNRCTATISVSLVRMRSPVQIWLAAPKENPSVWMGFCSLYRI